MSTVSSSRQELTAALNRAMRDASAKGVIYSQAVAERLGIGSADLECLDFIGLRGPISAGALAEAVGLTSGAITGVIDRLERAGLARRERSREDRRKVIVRLTPAVERRVVALYRPMEKAAMAALNDYRDEELQLLLEFFRRAGVAATTALSELRDLEKPSSRLRRGEKSAEKRPGRRAPKRNP
jgi:DNA-binding MarR family transcriptional regulator